MLVQQIPKPKKRVRRRARNNPVPTDQDRCRYHNTPYAQTHEVYYGTGKRQLSIKYGMQIKVCDICHRAIHRNKQLDLMLKREYQEKFEQQHSREIFVQVFGKNYLEVAG